MFVLNDRENRARGNGEINKKRSCNFRYTSVVHQLDSAWTKVTLGREYLRSEPTWNRTMRHRQLTDLPGIARLMFRIAITVSAERVTNFNP